MTPDPADKIFEIGMRNPYQKYAEQEILTADPVRLIQLLYRGALDSVAEARSKLAQGDVCGRSAAITKAVEILTELSKSLDHERGGELSARLAGLYDYMQRRLLAANFEQKDPPMAEVDALLHTLNQAWMNVEVMSVEAPSAAGRAQDLEWAGSRADDHVAISCAC